MHYLSMTFGVQSLLTPPNSRLPKPHACRMTRSMTSKAPRSAAAKAAVAVGAIGSAAIAAAFLYSSHRKEQRAKDKGAPPAAPSGEPPQTD